ncbi:peptide ABC transporter substrate-binding protein [Paenibacillus eucommiae]|uniref:Lipoprotein n=1 Tax=Paenibacillus eucommiae TaxID=1355755 RepID=A0ABS4J7L4_9BACL|nr:peptide ABC transporter substrate-binding protein [Paenibacillus eucommiae]MBP1995841.1 hypothetical protein [Paenibacillus eucommiae]
MRIKMTLIVIVLTLLTACAKTVDEEDLVIRVNTETAKKNYAEMAVVTNESELKKDMGEIYRLALDAFMPLGDGLTNNMKYIAIDMSSLKDLPEEDREKVLQYFSKYDVDVMDNTLDQLEKEGRLKGARSLEGILLRVKDTEIIKKKIIIEGSLYKSAKGAIGTSVVVEYLNGKWQVTKASVTWIS